MADSIKALNKAQQTQYLILADFLADKFTLDATDYCMLAEIAEHFTLTPQTSLAEFSVKTTLNRGGS